MTTSFDLRSKPWIPVETLRGERRQLSTRDVLCNAHELRAIDDESPLVIASLTRHLLAILHRAYDGPKDMNEWSAIAKAKRFDANKIDAYLDSDRVRDRFDLFHPERPFAQTRGVAAKFADSVQPIDELDVLRSSWGTARTLFRHRPDSAVSASPAHAARLLLAHQAFATGGLIRKQGEPDAVSASPLTKLAVVVLRGTTLAETLVCNLLVYAPRYDLPFPLGAATDECSWEGPGLPLVIDKAEERRVRPSGYLGLLTWIGRRIELVREADTVTGFVNAVGVGLAAESPRDPMATWRADPKRGWVPIAINTERAFWRSAAALFEAARNSSGAFDRPRAIALLAEPEATEALGEQFVVAVEAHGMDAEKSRVDALRTERVSVVARAIAHPDAGEAVRFAIAHSEQAVQALTKALWAYGSAVLGSKNRTPETDAVRQFVRSTGAEELAWSKLGVRFDALMRDVLRREALDEFRRDALAIVREAFAHGTVGSMGTGHGQRAHVVASDVLDANLPRIKRAPREPTATEESKEVSS